MEKGRNFLNSKAYQAWGNVNPSFDDKILEKMLPFVVNCHLHDNDGIWDLHGNVGTGSIDWKHIVALLEKKLLDFKLFKVKLF